MMKKVAKNLVKMSKQVFIRTPYRYPNGDVLDLVLTKKDNSLILSDTGCTLRWLAEQPQIDLNSPEQKSLVQWFCDTRGIEYHNGELSLKVHNASAISLDMQKLGKTAIEMLGLLTN